MITLDGLEPVFVVGVQQVRVGDDSARQDLPEEGQIILSYPGERESVRGGLRRWSWAISIGVQPLRTDPNVPPGAQLKATMGAGRRLSGQSPRREGATMSCQNGP